MKTGGIQSAGTNNMMIELTNQEMPKYDILTARSRSGLIKVVNAKLAEGFDIVGMPYIGPQKSWIQCVVKRRPSVVSHWSYSNEGSK